MTIAIHFSTPRLPAEIASDNIFNCFIFLAGRFPDHHFIFIFDQPVDISFITQKNITPVIANPQIKNRLLQHYFYNYKIPRLLKRYSASVFVCTGVCSLRTHIPQCILLPDLSFLHDNNLLSRGERSYLKRYAGLFFRKANSIAVLNSRLKELLQITYALNDKKINLLSIGLDTDLKKNISSTPEQTKQKLTGGKNYFICFVTPASEKNIIAVLKAFSILKKWQRSDMHLAFLFSTSKPPRIAGLGSYKFRTDVKIIVEQNKKHAADIISGAYAAIYLPEIELMEEQPLTALSLGIPLIISGAIFYKAFYKDAALYTSHEEKELSEKMMQLYKDEHFRNNLVGKENTLAEMHNRQKASGELWQLILTTAER